VIWKNSLCVACCLRSLLLFFLFLVNVLVVIRIETHHHHLLRICLRREAEGVIGKKSQSYSFLGIGSLETEHIKHEHTRKGESIYSKAI
jgi:hypothetical protein